MHNQRVKNLYSNGLSGSQISRVTKIDIRQVYRILARLGVSRRSSAEQNKINFLKSPLSFKMKEKFSVDERELLVAAVMLYYGEGAKTNKTVDLANADPKVLKVFLNFMRNICGVDEKRLRFYLYCFSNQDSGKLIKFWCKYLHVDKRNFTKPYVRSADSSLLRTMPYGVLHIRYSDSRLLKLILNLIEELTNKYIGGVVE